MSDKIESVANLINVLFMTLEPYWLENCQEYYKRVLKRSATEGVYLSYYSYILEAVPTYSPLCCFPQLVCFIVPTPSGCNEVAHGAL